MFRHGWWRLSYRSATALFFAAAALSCLLAEDAPPQRIASVADLGLRPGDLPISTETKIVYLVNPALNRRVELETALRQPRLAAGAGGFNPREVDALIAPSRPGDTAAYDAISDVAEQFLKYMFIQIPYTERSLHRIVQELNRADFPLVLVDAVPAIVAPGKQREVETLVTLRLFMVHVEADRERDLRWVTRCELCFEDSAVGRAPVAGKGDVVGALAASVIDALRGKLAVSFTHAPALRRPSGRIDEPRRSLIDSSIGDVVEATLGTPAGGARAPSPKECRGEAP